jgi:hypothetical protein
MPNSSCFVTLPLNHPRTPGFPNPYPLRQIVPCVLETYPQANAGLSAVEVHALRSLTNFLSSYRSSSGAPGDADDSLASDEDGELAEAFTYSSRTSGAVSTSLYACPVPA